MSALKPANSCLCSGMKMTKIEHCVECVLESCSLTVIGEATLVYYAGASDRCEATRSLICYR